MVPHVPGGVPPPSPPMRPVFSLVLHFAVDGSSASFVDAYAYCVALAQSASDSSASVLLSFFTEMRGHPAAADGGGVYAATLTVSLSAPGAAVPPAAPGEPEMREFASALRGMILADPRRGGVQLLYGPEPARFVPRSPAGRSRIE